MSWFPDPMVRLSVTPDDTEFIVAIEAMAYYNGRLGQPWEMADLVFMSSPPDNARPLVSRNKREGGYLGWRQLGPMQRFRSWDGGKAGHQRLGSELRCSTLRQRSRS